LEETLNGSIKVLIDVLSLASPVAFSRATRVARLMGKVGTKMKLAYTWQLKLAALLSQLGCITLPPGVLTKVNNREPLTLTEQNMYNVHPSVTYKLLADIPRLRLIAGMTERQNQPAGYPIGPAIIALDEDVVTLGGQMLKVILDLDMALTQGHHYHDTVGQMRNRPEVYNKYVVAALGELSPAEPETGDGNRATGLYVADLKTGMVVARDVWSKNGIMLVQKGQEITLAVLIRLRNFTQGIGVEEPVFIASAQYTD
jgi:hypothetical protein